MTYEIFPDNNDPASWRTEAVDDDGGCYVTAFSGPHAEARARQYAAWVQNQ